MIGDPRCMCSPTMFGLALRGLFGGSSGDSLSGTGSGGSWNSPAPDANAFYAAMRRNEAAGCVRVRSSLQARVLARGPLRPERGSARYLPASTAWKRPSEPIHKSLLLRAD